MAAEYQNVKTATAGPSDNANADVVIAAPGAGKRNVIIGIQSTYNADVSADKETQILEAAVVKWRLPMKSNPLVVSLPPGGCIYRGALNTAQTVRLEASGTAGMKGTVNVHYFIDPNG